MAAPKDGDVITLKTHGGSEITGRVRSFRPNDEHIASLKVRIKELEATNGTRWEIETGDPNYPAVGFDPKTAEIK